MNRPPFPSSPPSQPSPYRYLGRGGGERPVRIQLIIALVAALILVAVPLYLWRRPRPESIPSADAAVATTTNALAGDAPPRGRPPRRPRGCPPPPTPSRAPPAPPPPARARSSPSTPARPAASPSRPSPPSSARTPAPARRRRSAAITSPS